MPTGTNASKKNRPKEIDYQVVHFALGRFRFRVPRLASDPEYASRLTWLVESLDFVLSVRINPAARSIIVNYNASLVASTEVQQNLFTAIQQASLANIPTGALPTKPEFSSEINWERLGLSIFSLGIALLVSELSLPISPIVIGGIIAAAAAHFFRRVFDTVIKEGQIDTEILDAFWIGFHTIKGDFVTPALTLSLIESGNALRNTTARAAKRQALELLHDLNWYAWVERNGKERQLPLKEVLLGDKVFVYPGELIPVSGPVLHGIALIDEHKLTGESALVARVEGQMVYASTLVIEGKLCVLAERTGGYTHTGLAWELLQTVPVHDTRVENYAAKVANLAVIPICCLSATIFALTGDTTRALAPLQLDCCNGIGITVPTTILAALTHAARNGVYIRSGRALEVLARTDTIVFDKTGTLTQGKVAVVAVRSVDRKTPAEVLSLAASAEQGNTHPVACAIARYAQEQGVKTQKCETWDYRIGLGIAAQVDGQKILVGSNNLMRQAGVDLDPIYERYPDLAIDMTSLIYVARNGELLGVILYTDPVRPEVKSAIATLRTEGIDTYMLTGDEERVADDVAYQLGIDLSHTYAEVLPEKKIEIICWLRNQGKTVTFVGEGINDAAALAHADVSVSLAGGCALARETADVVLLDDDLQGLTHAIEIAKQAMEIIYLNTALAVIPNISVVIAGIVLALDPVLELIISSCSAIIAELNSFSPLFFERKKESNTDVFVTK